ncbi:MAG: tetratricopeptide repeat protein [Candidatus Hydrogenedentes bacterium]|nr:tetratricopeptide repeat protein [Candidatus Hydrogenedentota bacterium]
MGQGAEHSDLSGLTHYVVIHPDDYNRRWTLAKKLYMAWEYNDALKHLLILKKNWARRLNVLRYLAATYYRLGRYDEAVSELQEITRLWPDEIAVWEQLARVFEVAGKNAEAARAWEKIVAINPAHPLAARSVQRLRSPSPDSPRENLRLRDSDSGIDLSPYRICANCGAQNSDEFERCWQCHALITSGDADAKPGAHPVGHASKRWLFTLTGGLFTVAAVSASVYLTFIQIRRMQQGEAVLMFDSVYGVLAQHLLIPRLITAGALLVVWPMSLLLAFHLMNARPLTRSSAVGAGIMLASVSYLAMWAPLSWLLYAIAAPALCALAAIIVIGRESITRSLGLWVLQGIAPFIAGLGAFALAAGVQPILQFPAIMQYQSSLSALASPGRYPIFNGEADESCAVKWQTTGSTWLDYVGQRMVIEIKATDAKDALRAIVMLDKTVMGESTSPPYQIPVDVRTDAIYELFVYGSTGAYFHADSCGILVPQVVN